MRGRTLLGAAASAALVATWIAAGPAVAVPPLPEHGAADTDLVVLVQNHSQKTSRRQEREWEEEQRRTRRRCVDDQVSAKGKQRPTRNLAEASARTAWAEAVRFAHGEQFIDIENARDVRYRCTISSPTLRLRRCELIALPCRPKSDRKDGDK